MGLITNYGLFWRDDAVFWGAGNNPGALYGLPAKNTTWGQVDFRDQRGVYVLYAEYDIVYAGQNAASGLLTRLKQHRTDDLAGRWDRFSWFGVRRVLTSGKLSKYNGRATSSMTQVIDHIEAIVIHTSEPPLNRQGGKFGSQVEQYLQFRDERLGPSPEEMIREIYDRSDTE